MAPPNPGPHAQIPSSPPAEPGSSGQAARTAWRAPIAGLGLQSGAPELADLLRPLAWLGTQALLILQPTLGLLGAGRSTTRLTRYLEALEARPAATPPEEERCR